jgi:hypothetical protein
MKRHQVWITGILWAVLTGLTQTNGWCQNQQYQVFCNWNFGAAVLATTHKRATAEAKATMPQPAGEIVLHDTESTSQWTRGSGGGTAYVKAHVSEHWQYNDSEARATLPASVTIAAVWMVGGEERPNDPNAQTKNATLGGTGSISAGVDAELLLGSSSASASGSISGFGPDGSGTADASVKVSGGKIIDGATGITPKSVTFSAGPEAFKGYKSWTIGFQAGTAHARRAWAGDATADTTTTVNPTLTIS